MNLVVTIVVSVLLRGRRRRAEDRTKPPTTTSVEAGDPGVKDVDAAPEEAAVPAGRSS